MIHRERVPEWIIESPELFSKYVGASANKQNKDEGEFVLSENNTGTEYEKDVEIGINALSVEITDHRKFK